MKRDEGPVAQAAAAPVSVTPGAWVVVRNPGPGARRLDTFERYELPPMRERVRGAKVPAFLPPMHEVSLPQADAARAIAAGLERVRAAS